MGRLPGAGRRGRLCESGRALARCMRPEMLNSSVSDRATDRATDQPPAAVRRRRVFYIPGYDPFPPRRYRELYRFEAAQQAVASGHEISLCAKPAGGPYGWSVRACIEGAVTEADVEVLVWSDIVRRSMRQGIAATYLQLLHTAWTYLRSGALMRLIRLRKGPMIAALYPIIVLLMELLLVCGIAWALAHGLGAVIGPGWGAVALKLAVGCAMVWAGLWMFRRIDRHILAWYLMHDYAFTAAFAGANPPALEQRMAVFGDAVAAALQENWDEVLVVGHSSGAHLAVSVLADLIRGGRVPVMGPHLGLLSLGQVVPMVSFLPGAGRLRSDLAYLSERPEVTWVDVTAPGDGCAFALCDPVSVSGMAGPGKRWPLVVSAAFTQTLSPQRWKALRWQFFRLHFQYLCAFDNLPGIPGDYDYFAITAGPRSLAARFRDRAPSKSRIETPSNPYGVIK